MRKFLIALLLLLSGCASVDCPLSEEWQRKQAIIDFMNGDIR